jgi:putative membrane protein
MITASLTEIVAQSRGWDHMSGWDGGWMWLWGTLMMLSWVAIIAAAVWFVLRANRDGGTRTARDVLDERLASGELTPEEYRERREAMR